MATARRVVLIPGQSISHLTPMMEFAAVCIRRGLAVTVAVPDPALTSPAFRSTIGRYAARLPSLSVHSLPPPPAHHHSLDAAHPFIRIQAGFRSQAPGLRDFLRSLPAVHALVADMFAAYLLDVAAEVGIPGHLFYCTGAANLTVFLELPSFCSANVADLKDLGDAPVSFPGVPTMPASHLVDGVLDSGTDLYAAVLDVFGRMAAARGILANTFEALESSAVAAIRDGRCLRGRAAPRVYCVGPLIAEGGAEEEEERHPCLPWLDAQPEGSVVYICFGSRCTVSLEQIREMAKGLEMSGHRFLWVLRAPPAFAAAAGEPDATLSLLPEGFLARTADRGLVVTASWVPQMDVLRHASTGTFITHCGWNSTLEAAATGVPMVCWPLEAEQWMNKVYIVEEMKVGVAVRGYAKPGVLVTADNVDATVRQIMDMESEGRRAVVERAMAVKESAAAAWKESGSSCAAFAEFVKQME
uniref:Predicted protein n=1 Tax=Hordeum vulgare subsp. vulgare TaxID=112509 RepID=F2CTH4_HORVV|nr:predicted protein [Hordeum vulgare subsp. vulgare]